MAAGHRYLDCARRSHAARSSDLSDVVTSRWTVASKNTARAAGRHRVGTGGRARLGMQRLDASGARAVDRCIAATGLYLRPGDARGARLARNLAWTGAAHGHPWAFAIESSRSNCAASVGSMRSEAMP